MEKKEYHIIIVCCVCKKQLGLKMTDKEEQHLKHSHSYCPQCAEALMAEIEQITIDERR